MEEGNVVCPYHGWRFNAQGGCSCVPGMVNDRPQKARDINAYPVIEQDGMIWVYASTDEPQSQPPRIALLHERGYVHFSAERSMNASLPDALENFLDGTHTHFVHSGLIRTDGRRKMVNVTVRRETDRVEAQYQDEGAQSGLIWRLFGGGIDGTFGRYIFPSTAQMEYRAGANVKMLITLFFTPESETKQRLFAVVSGRGSNIFKPIVQLLFLRAFQQDARILGLQSANLKRFGEARYVFTELDVLLPDILRMMKHGPVPAPASTRTSRMLL